MTNQHYPMIPIINSKMCNIGKQKLKDDGSSVLQRFVKLRQN